MVILLELTLDITILIWLMLISWSIVACIANFFIDDSYFNELTIIIIKITGIATIVMITIKLFIILI